MKAHLLKSTNLAKIRLFKKPPKKTQRAAAFIQQAPCSVHHSGPRTPVQSAGALFLSSNLWFISNGCMSNIQSIGLLFDSGLYLVVLHNLKMSTTICMCGFVYEMHWEKLISLALFMVINKAPRLSFTPSVSSVLIEQCPVHVNPFSFFLKKKQKKNKTKTFLIVSSGTKWQLSHNSNCSTTVTCYMYIERLIDGCNFLMSILAKTELLPTTWEILGAFSFFIQGKMHFMLVKLLRPHKAFYSYIYTLSEATYKWE